MDWLASAMEEGVRLQSSFKIYDVVPISIYCTFEYILEYHM